MHRHQLEKLSLSDLRYYYGYHRLELPPPHQHTVPGLVEGILAHQAQVISQRAIDSQLMLDNPLTLGELNFITKETARAAPPPPPSANTKGDTPLPLRRTVSE